MRRDKAFGGMEPMPVQRLALPLRRSFNEREMRFIRFGREIQVPEQRWEIRYRRGVLRIRRWSVSFCKWEVRFAKRDGRWEIAEAWVNRDPEQYQPTDDAQDLDFLEQLLTELAAGGFYEESKLTLDDLWPVCGDATDEE